ncbi:MAG: ribonuclease PH [Thermoleophilia bacterium]|nr:ribonuclease PH [Thermoleophilia bacterium]
MNDTHRGNDRGPTALRPLRVIPDFVGSAQGSVLFEIGSTRVLCTASITNGVPRRLRGTGTGWLTAEYSLLPGSTAERSAREAVQGRQGGRTVEIQRLIGRSLRAVTDLSQLGERTVYVDCDVVEADGGTRCAAISGGYLALHLALKRAVDQKVIGQLPLTDSLAAVSVGVVAGMPMLDLDYAADSTADVDMNVVMTGSGRLVEVQATAEKVAFDRSTFEQLLDLAEQGVREITAAQRSVINATYGQGSPRVRGST